MPIHLIWGDDEAGTNREIDKLITQIVDSTWASLNTSRINGDDILSANKALEEIRTPPFGSGGRVIVVKKHPFCNGCSMDLGAKFTNSIESIPNNCHLILQNIKKPDSRLKTTKILKDLMKSNKEITEKSFILPSVWDDYGKKELIERTAEELGLNIKEDAIYELINAIGNDSARLNSELEKLSLYAESRRDKNINTDAQILISKENIIHLTTGLSTNALQVADSLLSDNIGEALFRIDALLNDGEPALRILASLTSQVRGWLWVSLLDQRGETDIKFIAKTAGIANPKRIYVIRKQIKQKTPSLFLNLLGLLLEIEVSLKKGVNPSHAFKDTLLQTANPHHFSHINGIK